MKRGKIRGGKKRREKRRRAIRRRGKKGGKEKRRREKEKMLHGNRRSTHPRLVSDMILQISIVNKLRVASLAVFALLITL